MADINTVRSRWTAKDEANLIELKERKERITAENMGPVTQLLLDLEDRFLRAGQQATILYPILASWLAENAEAVRDALEPFDSGIRLDTRSQ